MSSTWVSVRDSLEKVLPFAVGVVNPVLGGIVATALGTKSDPDSITSALASDPQAAEKLLAFKTQIQTAAINAQVELAQADTSDRTSARQAFGVLRFLPQVIITSLTSLGLGGIIVAMATHALQPDSSQAVLFGTLVTGLLTAWLQQMNFWFGSTHGSQKKDDTLAQAALAD